jgi:phospholipid/cholesterol/gamma-HCH transport system permease protein
MNEQHGFSIERVGTPDGEAELRVKGQLKFADSTAIWNQLRRVEKGSRRGQTLNFEMSEVEQVDGGAMALLACIRADLHRIGVKSEFVAADERIKEIIHLYGGDRPVARLTRRRARGVLDQLGAATLAILLEVQLVFAFFGQMIVSGRGIIRSPKSANWRDLPPTMERTGADAVPIVTLINLLVGLAMAFQAAAQLKRYGANIYVADLIGISVTRELGPLMTAIVVCGRSGAAFAAELGFMQVNEEVDALKTMGFGVMRFLVLPRLFALVLVMPLLTFLADVAGVLGGLVVGVTTLDLTFTGYLRETARSVSIWDISSGLIKSFVFAGAIALIACQQGIATSGGAEGVGRRTTSAVVVTLFTLILIDAIATVFFRVAGL